jgi:hypothetical protein
VQPFQTGESVETKAIRGKATAPSEFGKQISNTLPRANKFPSARAKGCDIERLALTFDGYNYWGGQKACAVVGDARRQGTLTGLRTCLFLEQRRWRRAVFDMKTSLDKAKITNQPQALGQAAGPAFDNTLHLVLRGLKARASQQQPKADFEVLGEIIGSKE